MGSRDDAVLADAHPRRILKRQRVACHRHWQNRIDRCRGRGRCTDDRSRQRRQGCDSGRAKARQTGRDESFITTRGIRSGERCSRCCRPPSPSSSPALFVCARWRAMPAARLQAVSPAANHSSTLHNSRTLRPADRGALRRRADKALQSQPARPVQVPHPREGPTERRTHLRRGPLSATPPAGIGGKSARSGVAAAHVLFP